jgi:CPA1 family monovalent cation:H+ antiporter
VDLFDVITVLITLSALFSYLNYRYLHLPRVIGLLLFGLVLSCGIVAAGFFHPAIKQSAAELVSRVDFNRLLLRGMLAFLLFAGPLRLGMESLLREKWVILLLSTLGVLLSTAIVAALTWAIFALLGNPVPVIYCLLFGALISPTDPIAVFAIMQKLRAPEALQTVMAGESLFNDGIGVVIFIVLLQSSVRRRLRFPKRSDHLKWRKGGVFKSITR